MLYDNIYHLYIRNEDIANVDDFKKELSNNPITIYYELAQPETIQLTPTDVPLFNGENHITLLENIETNTNIRYVKHSPLTEAFETHKESESKFKILSNEISSSINQVEKEIGENSSKIIETSNDLTQKITDSANSTKSELNTKITNVDNKVNNLQIGGRNLVANSNFLITKTKNDGSSFETLNIVDNYDLNSLIGKRLTFSYFVNVEGERKNASGSMGNRFGMHGSVVWEKDSGETNTIYPFTGYLTIGTCKNERIAQQYVLTPPAGYTKIKTIAISVQAYAVPGANNNSTWKLGLPKLEIGNKATDYSPAPEDYTNTTEMSNIIEQIITDTNTSINMEVSKAQTILNNQLQNTNEKFNNYATLDTLTKQIATVKATIDTAMAQLKIINETVENGVPILKTSTGFTFDINGLDIDNTQAKNHSTLGTDALSIINKSNNNTVLFAGYDKTTQETIVKSNNMTVEKYLKVPHARFEKYKTNLLGEGVGIFYVE